MVHMWRQEQSLGWDCTISVCDVHLLFPCPIHIVESGVGIPEFSRIFFYLFIPSQFADLSLLFLLAQHKPELTSRCAWHKRNGHVSLVLPNGDLVLPNEEQCALKQK